MKHNYYIVVFQNNKRVLAICANETEAEILGMAVMIKNGLTRDIKSITKTNYLTGRDFVDFVA